jgi:hypothetical protein
MTPRTRTVRRPKTTEAGRRAPAADVPVHPRTLARGTKQPATARVRALAYSPLEERMRWIERELVRADALLQVARSVANVVSALVDDPAPRPQILIIDIDALTPGEILDLHAIRERGWTGSVVALGRVPASLRSSLGVERAIAAPFIEDALCDEISKHRCAVETQTMQIPRITD